MFGKVQSASGKWFHTTARLLIGAALREGYVLPLFIQGDHCQVNHKKYQADPEGEVGEVKKLIAEEVGAGFYNIDVDTSTLVDLAHPTLEEQQRLNYERAAEITAFIRDSKELRILDLPAKTERMLARASFA